MENTFTLSARNPAYIYQEDMIRKTLHVPVEKNTTIAGSMVIPKDASALIIFSNNNSTGRFNPRSKLIAEMLQKENIATLLLDLLTIDEDRDCDNRFNIELQVNRLVKATEWVSQHTLTKNFKIGYFGTNTETVSDFRAIAQLGEKIKAIVSEGVLDFPTDTLHKIKSPVLLIVGGLDLRAKWINGKAFMHLNADKKMIVVPGATDVFEGQGKLHEVARLTIMWYKDHLLEREVISQ